MIICNTKIKIKPLSVNSSWQGRRFKTRAYEDFERSLFYLLPTIVDREPYSPKTPLELHIEAGIPTSMDLSNILKLIEDVLQKRYGFNDRYVEKIIMNKKRVKKGEEYLIISLFTR